MPELPEVEIMTRALGRWTGGHRLRSLRVVDDAVWKGGRSPGSVSAAPIGRAWRRAKYSVLDVGDLHLVLHYRMTGKLCCRTTAQPAPTAARLTLLLDEGSAVDFVDPRRLGSAWLLDDVGVASRFAALGPEPWPRRRDGDWWRERLAGLRGAIKPALLRQDRVAGIGNILACESLWRARVDPRRCVPRLDATAWAALADAIPAAIDHVLAVEEPIHMAQGSLSYVNQGGPNPFSVYGRVGQACPRCGHAIQRIVQSGRGTWWCPGCQR